MRRELIFNSILRETRVALLEDGLPAEFFIERSRSPGIVGNIYRGRVTNVLPGMQSAFVDIGLDRDAFIYVTDLLPLSSDAGDVEFTSQPAAARPVRRGPAVETFLKEGQELLVQVTKESLGSKGPRVTTQVSLPGRRLVLLPESSHRAVSRRIEPQEEKDRLSRLVADLSGKEGFIVRTAGAGSSLESLESEVEGLRGGWEEILRRAAEMPVPSCVHTEADLSLKVMRDLFTSDIDRVVIDREETYRRCREYAARVLPQLAHRVELHTGPEEVFEAYGIEKELQRALRRRVWLPSGGYIVIHPTEALVAIDVNTGKYVGTSHFEETALRTNVEAAREIVRQIRLRDLGGILVIDFIDLEEEESRRQLAGALEAEMKWDRAKSRVLQISEFGLVEITRQRVRRSLESVLSRSCPTCRGSGRVRSAETLRSEIKREIRKLLPLIEGGDVTIRAHPDVAALLSEDRGDFEEGLGTPGRLTLRVEAVCGFHPEQFEVVTG